MSSLMVQGPRHNQPKNVQAPRSEEPQHIQEEIDNLSYRNNLLREAREFIKELLKSENYVSSVESAQTEIRIGDISQDIFHAREQFKLMRQESIPAFVAVIETELNQQQALVPVKIDNLDNYEEDIIEKLAAIDSSDGIQVREIDQTDYEEQFEIRISEFLTKRISSVIDNVNFGQDPTIVDSNRDGDVIIYCKGYFFSTQLAFGLSTPAKKILSPGQYCFGIMDKSGVKFQNLLWSVPSSCNVRVDLP
jgi:hypothetical protein